MKGVHDGSNVEGFTCTKKMDKTPVLRSNGIQFFGAPLDIYNKFNMKFTTIGETIGVPGNGVSNFNNGIASGAVSIFEHAELEQPKDNKRGFLSVGSYNMARTLL